METNTVTETVKPDAKAMIAELVDSRLDAKLAPMMDLITKAVAAKEPPKEPEKTEKSIDLSDFENRIKAVEANANSRIEAMELELKAKGGDGATTMPNGVQIYKMAAGEKDPNALRVKGALERYDGSKKQLLWQDTPRNKAFGMAGNPAYIMENATGAPNGASPKYFDELSQREKAKCGVWAKFRMKMPLNQHEQDVLNDILHNDKFVEVDNSVNARQLKDHEIHNIVSANGFQTKAPVLDETGGSGGHYAVPEYFDYAAIFTPLLSGELYPFVEVVPVPRGGSANGYTVGTPTFVSTASGSAITPFTVTSFVGQFATTFFPATCAITMGRDFLEDAAPGFADSVLNQIGEESKRWLDEQIAIGDGTTEPTGIFTGSATSVLTASGHTQTSLSYTDVLNLAFGITKPHRNNWGGMATRFVMNDTQYKRLMQVATGVTGDTRPIFGMALKDYMLGDYAVSVQNDITNGYLALVNLRGYRLYRRKGISFSTETAGQTLALSNTQLFMARMRWGGQITKSGYIAKMVAG